MRVSTPQARHAVGSIATTRTKTKGSGLRWKIVSLNLTNLIAAHCIVDKLGGDSTCGMFCLFDGHGGRQVSEYCAERFPVEFKKEMAKSPADLNKTILDIFAKIDKELKLIDADGCGSTACCAITRREGS